jgi:hypothetical protein
MMLLLLLLVMMMMWGAWYRLSLNAPAQEAVGS